MCLTSDLGAYYTSSHEGRDQFGRKGDFITSPEISQIFGELLGLWFVTEWMSQGRKSGVVLIEIGPGRGTLMDDMLRTIRNFNPMPGGIEAVYMVEASPALRETQKQLLCGGAEMAGTEYGHQSVYKHGNVPVRWVENIKSIPSEPSNIPFIVAHEFFDALPIHAFQSVPPNPNEQTAIKTPSGEPPLAQKSASNKDSRSPQWRELVVSPTPPGFTHTLAGTPKSQQSTSPPPEFQLTLSKSSTPHSLYLPETSPRYHALKEKPGSVIEISPESIAYVQEFARRIGGAPTHPKHEASGAAIILDYGPVSTIPTNSLRGIQNHKRVSPFASPGLVDLSADVDFTALAEAALAASPGVEVHGPVEQAWFLSSMGIRERAEILMRGVDDKRRKEIEGACERLVDRGPNGMGKVYKAMAIVPENGGKRRPVGFGGDVEGVD